MLVLGECIVESVCIYIYTPTYTYLVSSRGDLKLERMSYMMVIVNSNPKTQHPGPEDPKP